MILRVILGFAIFVGSRIVLVRSTKKPVFANIGASAIVVVFALGWLTAGLPEIDRDAIAPDAAPSPVAAASASSAPLETAHDVSAICRRERAKASKGGLGSLDSVAVASDGSSPATTGATISRNDPHVALGWGAGEDRRPLAAACLLVDGRIATHAVSTYGYARADVARYFGTAALSASGFTIAIPAGSLPYGKHVLSIATVARDGSVRSLGTEFSVVVR